MLLFDFTPNGQIPLILLWGKCFHLPVLEMLPGLVCWATKQPLKPKEKLEVSVML